MSTSNTNSSVPSLLNTLRKLAPHWLDDSADLHTPEALLAPDLLKFAVSAGASDVHVSIDERRAAKVSLRIHGAVSNLLSLEPERAEILHRQIRVMCGLSTSPTRRPEQGHARIETDDGLSFDIRMSAVPTSTGASLAIRILTTGVTDFTPQTLGLQTDDERTLRRWFSIGGGLLLIVGPTGCGKTTTLYTLLRHCIEPDSRVLTLEQPVEADLAGIVQIPASDEPDNSLRELIQHALRQDPDVIAIGEILDAETAQAAVKASLAGHGVLATAHAPSAPGAVTWLRHCGVHDYEISETLSAVLAQRLVRTLCAKCKKRMNITPDHAELFASSGLDIPEALYERGGCDQCRGAGYTGRTGVFDLWTPAADDPSRIRGGEDHSMLDQSAGGLLRAGLRLAAGGDTTIHEVLRTCPRTGPILNTERGIASRDQRAG